MTNNTKKVYLIYNCDDMHYEPTHAVMPTSRSAAKKQKNILKSLKKKMRKIIN